VYGGFHVVTYSCFEKALQTCRKVTWVIVFHGCLIEAQVVSVVHSEMELERNCTNKCINDCFMLSSSFFSLKGCPT